VAGEDQPARLIISHGAGGWGGQGFFALDASPINKSTSVPPKQGVADLQLSVISMIPTKSGEEKS